MQNRVPLISDEELVKGSLLGNMEAFDELVRRFRSAVLLVAEQTLGSEELAEDVAQEVFLLAFKALPQLHDPTKFAPWLHAITRNCARRVGMKEGRSRVTEPSAIDRLILNHSRQLGAYPAQQCLDNCERDSVRQLLAQLPTDYRTPLLLYYYEDWSVAKIAQFLLLPRTTVKWRLHHGRQMLKRHLLTLSEEREDE